jgi:hypothetical protein
MTAEMRQNTLSLLRQYWWLAWCLAVAYWGGAVGYESLSRCNSYPALLLAPLTIGAPIFFSKLIALYFVGRKWNWKIFLVPLILAGISAHALWFMQVYVIEHHFAEVFAMTPLLLLTMTYFVTLSIVDTTVLFISRCFDRNTFWIFGLLNLALTKWFSEYLVYATNY